MKMRVGLVWLLSAVMLLSAGIITATGSDLSEAVLIGQADNDGHGDEEAGHADEDDHHGEDEAGHGAESDAHADDGHHDEPFTWASLIPLFAGIGVATIVSGTSWGLFKKELNGLQLAIIALAFVTGILHLLLGLAGDRLLLLNGIGYLSLLGLLYSPIGVLAGFKNLVRLVLIGYTLITIVGYFWLHSPAQYDALAIASKVVEVTLIIVLVLWIAQVQNAER